MTTHDIPAAHLTPGNPKDHLPDLKTTLPPVGDGGAEGWSRWPPEPHTCTRCRYEECKGDGHGTPPWPVCLVDREMPRATDGGRRCARFSDTPWSAEYLRLEREARGTSEPDPAQRRPTNAVATTSPIEGRREEIARIVKTKLYKVGHTHGPRVETYVCTESVLLAALPEIADAILHLIGRGAEG